MKYLTSNPVYPVIKVGRITKIVNAINDGTMSNIGVNLYLESATTIFEEEISIDFSKPYMK
jgi:hypothetical protein